MQYAIYHVCSSALPFSEQAGGHLLHSLLIFLIICGTLTASATRSMTHAMEAAYRGRQSSFNRARQGSGAKRQYGSMTSSHAGDIMEEDDHIHYSNRSGWLRAAVLGANDGLVSTSALLMGVGAANSSRSQVCYSSRLSRVSST
jgi:VIT family